MRRIHFLTIGLGGLAVVTLIGCGNQYTEKVVGTWDTTIPSAPRMKLDKDGRGSITTVFGGQNIEKPVKWRLNGSNLIFKVDGREVGGIITKIDEHNMILNDPKAKADIYLKRVETSPPVAAKPAPATPPMPAPPEIKPPPVTGPATVPSSLGLIASWPFDEGQGKVAHDDLAKGLPATIHGGTWVPGVKGSALRLGGNGEHVDLGADPRLNFAAGAGFTVSGWVATTAHVGVISSFRRRSSPFPGIAVNVNKGRLLGFVRDDTSGSGAAKVAGELIADGKWHHFALLRQVDGAVDLFLDGVFQVRDKGKSSSGPITTDLRALGSDRFLATSGKKAPPDLAGTIDEFRVFNRALSGDEIAAIVAQSKK